MAGRSTARLRARLGMLGLGLICALLISASAIAQDDPRRRPAAEPVVQASAREPAASAPAGPAQPPSGRIVLTEREKRCRMARHCAMDEPCAPCDR